MNKTAPKITVNKKVLIVAGGSGGHIFPALAVADVLKQQNCEVLWLGSKVGLEQKLVSPHYKIFYIAIDRVRGKNFFKKLFSTFKMTLAFFQSGWILLKNQPDVVLTMGGFVAGPCGIAAWLLRKPLVLHEANAVAGYTNRILARLANKVLCGFPDAFSKKINVVDVGNPVRRSITTISSPEVRFQGRDHHRLRLLVLGGSQGASYINDLLIQALQDCSLNPNLDIWHQTGKKDHARISELYAHINVNAKVSEFIDDMVTAYSWADFAVCRSGAMTVSELAAVGLGSLLIPFPYAVDNHQYYNAKYLENASAAYLCLQQDMSKEKLIACLQELIFEKKLLCEMAMRARSLVRANAAHEVAKICAAICR